ncbi:hypothetical protein SDRG_05457 [Saprolegnia diclina VS20]|uniref:Calcineurin-like phosphoesterase domain-containing protein n=1 Tax=Saprolegnia diclina (strain VS20) TaxID=1156394 RepID=T0S3B0_SAPDV|nr:hypothetical protein SDRG_05457 [Saprolegnia diclina VS20]EQC37232.1 hypothetical protein SDRG_05457 [Saprolegnia diclina VS20]|eukprot:XP_008609394.1 hypothetical protein SDRG_05457 [Saprolegnia diclina VS20]
MHETHEATRALLSPATYRQHPLSRPVVRGTIAICVLVAVLALVAWATLPDLPQSAMSVPVLSRADYDDLIDPETAPTLLTLLAIGDWGGTLGKEMGDPGSCCVMYNGSVDTRSNRYKVDFYAQAYVADLLAASAAQLSPARIVSHGDNIYWVGVGMDNAAYRLEQTFEAMYDQPSLRHIPWLNVAGNHDIGGASFICGDKEPYYECSSADELVAYLDRRFEAQASYKSPHGDRWVLRDHYYLERIVRDKIVVEVYNIDTNNADNHGGASVCCQCYGYAAKYGFNAGECDAATRGDRGCVLGNTEMFDACMDRIDSWADDSYTRMAADLAVSDADFTLVNTHFSPHYHMAPAKMARWIELCERFKVTAWLNGHTHGFNHDIGIWGIHFFMNGGGGGYFTANNPIVTTPTIQNQWLVVGEPYGFLELSFSRDWLKVQFATFDSDWRFGGFDLSETTVGGVARGHCWFLPRASAGVSPVGLECNASFNGPIGAPLQWR